MEALFLEKGRSYTLALKLLDALFERPSEARERLEQLLPELSNGERQEVEQMIRVVERLEACVAKTEKHFRTRPIQAFRKNVGRFISRMSGRQADS